jgi:hypothetical protein
MFSAASFFVEIVFQLKNTTGNTYSFDKQMHVFHAENYKSAYQAASLYATQALDERNLGKQEPLWEFAGIELLQLLDKPHHTEYKTIQHYSIPTLEEAVAHVNTIRHKQENLQLAIAQHN